MEKIRLDECSKIELSSIDKKSKKGEKDVLLCNFTDVYYNWAIYSTMVHSFMKATASEDNIKTFSLRKGDVVITKDSETKDDIGVAAYIADDLDNVVLGYHCALIRPTKNMNGSFITGFLNTKMGRKFFEYQASGSGQRYTLTKESIGLIQIPKLSSSEQNNIGEFLESLDRTINVNNNLRQNYNEISNLLFNRWFLQYKISEDINFEKVWNEDLEKDIPVGWSVVEIGSIITELPKSKIQVNEAKNCVGDYPFFTSGLDIFQYDSFMVDGLNLFLSTGGNANISYFDGPCSYSTDTWCIDAGVYSYYLFLYIKSIKNFYQLFFAGTGLKHLQKELFKNQKILLPPINIIEDFNRIVGPLFSENSKYFIENIKLNKLREWILPILISGQITFN